MRRVKLGYDVFDAAVNRLVSVYEQGHTVVVSMSGGKDSAICLEIALIAAEMTGSLPVNACLQDEEIAYPGTFEYLERVAARPDVNFKWFVCHQPMVNVFNRPSPYFWCFDKLLSPDEWVRTPPECAIENPEQNIESIVNPKWFPVPEGKHLVDVTGLRVSESAKRLLGLVSSRGYMTSVDKRGGRPYQRCRPIYDWTDSDVWRAFHENGWDYNRAYDVMVRMGIPKKQLRIGPPTMNVYAADALKVASRAWPRWFDRVCKRLPGVRQAGHFGRLAATPPSSSVRDLATVLQAALHRRGAGRVDPRSVDSSPRALDRNARPSLERPVPSDHPVHELRRSRDRVVEADVHDHVQRRPVQPQAPPDIGLEVPVHGARVLPRRGWYMGRHTDMVKRFDFRLAVAALVYESDPMRVEQARFLLDTFAAFHPRVESPEVVAFNRFPDSGHLGVGENARRAWGWGAGVEHASHVLVIQDDAVTCMDVVQTIDQIVQVAPRSLLSFMEWTNASEEARARSIHWVETRANAMGVAILMPRPMVVEMLSWIDTHYTKALWPFNADDSMIAAWCMASGVRPMHPVPTPFQHGLPDKSTLGHSNRNRYCRWSLAPGQFGGSVDWSIGFDAPVRRSATLAPVQWMDENFANWRGEVVDGETRRLANEEANRGEV
jgi:3'-phosphoadenosine 5'-phosphosulfate sulfotransferase (PAPS reductase)/FAD synthetase